MTLENRALIAEIVASGTVVVSLIFVGIQLRDNTRPVRLSLAPSPVEAAAIATDNASLAFVFA